MTKEMHSASRTILATARAIFRAHVDPEVLVKWRAPAGMSARLTEFDARPGGGYRMELRYTDSAGHGKSTTDSDIVRVRFIDLVPDDLIVEAAEFESDNPANAGVMRITTRLTPVSESTKVVVTAEDVPASISAVDHRQGMESSLRNLALLLE
ncbi:MAG TPA: SRPBCC domain-containing protein [Sphingomonas sp.]|nr:SRPBCC domain-containing protein [Sphingomonas sp.]